ncbi:glutathione S-transferase family protein [Kovacikia minuta CCNUW1]|uniref:glutathione S-transferase family protein n=1 Tax=Kovacikia minuta TaxID=2931930 RepID=UPI001CC9CD16|nr:glutathione S-transferase family protein [Kovacikia minuta]UBF29228.1 glutathione S-transferase family protein [Kovacikia minuta CCNUW1]
MLTVEIYSAQSCPYAQRSRMALLEKGVPFELVEIDLFNKPQGFAEISPYGKVPVIRYGDDRVWESAVINEYLEEMFPEPPLLPREPGLRAIARIWIDFANTKLIPAFYKLLVSQDAETQAEWAGELEKHFRFMETEGFAKLSGNGPYWMGESLNLVDLSVYPWFERLPALNHYQGIGLPVDCLRLRNWWMAMQLRDSVRATAQSAEFHVEQYAKYIRSPMFGAIVQEVKRL